jgi:hypothetical protein
LDKLRRYPAHIDAPNLSCHAKRIGTVKGAAVRPLWQAEEVPQSHCRYTTPAARRRHSGIEIKQGDTSRISRLLADFR